MSLDYPRAWQIARATPPEQHHPKCSFRVTEGCILCDCDVVWQHPEQISETLYGADGAVIRPAPVQLFPPISKP